jgi:hypothetical protein
MMQGEKLVKPGWVRFNLNYFLDNAEAEFILDAMDFVAKHGTTLLPYYAYDQGSDLWRFQGKSSTPKSLNDLLWQLPKVEQKTSQPEDKSVYLTQAEDIVKQCLEGLYTPQEQPFNKEFNDIKRFVLAEDLV